MAKPLLEFIQDTNAKKYKQFRQFKKELREMMEQKNDDRQWESPYYLIERNGKKKGPYSSRMSSKNIIEIGENAFEGYPFTSYTRKLKNVQVLPYKKTGFVLKIEYENRIPSVVKEYKTASGNTVRPIITPGRPIRETDDIWDDRIPPGKVNPTETYEHIFLPECASGFIRDWARDGICIERVKEEYK